MSDILDKTYKEAVKGIQEEWFYSSNEKWYNYIMNLPLNQRVVYMIEILDAQVFNGGFDQYFTNGYGQFAKETIDALKLVKAVKRSEILQKALACVKDEKNSDSEFRKRLLSHDVPELFKDEIINQLDKLDTMYDDLEEVEVLEELVENYLTS